MLNSLEELDQELRSRGGCLQVRRGEVEQVLGEFLVPLRIEAVYINRDYTPFSRRRDESIKAVCKAQGVILEAYGDVLLHEPEDVHKDNGSPYTVFTPFWKRSSSLPLRKSRRCSMRNFLCETSGDSGEVLRSMKPETLSRPFVKGGRKEGSEILSGLGSLAGKESRRDEPAIQTTGLSAHLKFGTISIREAYERISKVLGSNSPFLRQLYWRDFFSHIAWHFPHVFEGAFHRKLDALEWNEDEESFRRWRHGETGFPVVDAGMRQLNTTGYMHNRARLIVASFLTKDLQISWRWGERYFAQRLIDYDPAVNNGNWQWSASTGCDAQPYFRIFNPWLQQKKFDSDAAYIKTWLPELSNLSTSEIHGLEKKRPLSLSYPPPMVDHSQASLEAKAMFAEVSG